MEVVCPKTWGALAETPDPAVRHCSECQQDVHLCTTDEETIAHARAGHCIAREVPDASELPRLVVGRSSRPIEVTPAEERARAWHGRERGIDILLNERIREATRTCPSCSYPVPDFRKSCYVCGCEIGRA